MKRFTMCAAVCAFLFLWAVPVQAQDAVPDVTETSVLDEGPVFVAEPSPEVPDVIEDEAVPEPSEEMPVTPEELGETIDKAILAAEGGHWTVLAGFCIMILIWVFRRIGLLQKWEKGLPWLAMVVGGVIVFAAYLASGYPVGMSFLYAFFSGGSAVALWEMIFKHVDRKIQPSG